MKIKWAHELNRNDIGKNVGFYYKSAHIEGVLENYWPPFNPGWDNTPDCAVAVKDFEQAFRLSPSNTVEVWND